MTLSGLILKEFNMKYSENVINGWDCRMDNGKYLSSGVYLVASSHPTKGPRLGKLAVINR